MQAVSQSKVLAFALGAVASFLLIGVVNTQSGRNVIDPGGTGTDNPDRAYSRGVRIGDTLYACLLYTSPSPRDATLSRMPSSA